MRVLVVKLTSMGDVLHLMPALSDLLERHPNAVVDWMVEDAFAELPQWHRSVDRVIAVGTRRWRKPNRSSVSEFLAFWKRLRSERYDVIVDAQGLIKSAVFARFARLKKGGRRAGFSGASIKETPAARLYSHRVDVARKQHAIDRLRALFAGIFDYPIPLTAPRYAAQISSTVRRDPNADNTVMFLHGTTWPSKHLPDQRWRELVTLADHDGYLVKLCWGNEVERERAQWIAQGQSHVTVMPKSSLGELAAELKSVAGAISVDTGLGHMAAAFGVPCVSVYGSTDAALTGAVGRNQVCLQSVYACSPCLLKECPKLTKEVTSPPCYSVSESGTHSLSADALWQALYRKIV